MPEGKGPINILKYSTVRTLVQYFSVCQQYDYELWNVLNKTLHKGTLLEQNPEKKQKEGELFQKLRNWGAALLAQEDWVLRRDLCCLIHGHR